jgi:hypothetical protein
VPSIPGTRGALTYAGPRRTDGIPAPKDAKDTSGNARSAPSTAMSGRRRPTSIRSTSINAFHVVDVSAQTTVATVSETSKTGRNSSTSS